MQCRKQGVSGMWSKLQEPRGAYVLGTRNENGTDHSGFILNPVWSVPFFIFTIENEPSMVRTDLKPANFAHARKRAARRACAENFAFSLLPVES